MKETNIRIYETREYSIFKTLRGNRVIDDNRVGSIIESINEVGLMHAPVVVNEKFELIDGQHRVEACKRLGMPVYFYIEEGAGMQTCIAMNRVAKTWTDADYIHMFADQGNKEYAQLRDLIVKYKGQLNQSIIIAVAAGHASGDSVRIREGAFSLCDTFDEIDSRLEYLCACAPMVPQQRTYLTAINAVALRFDIVDKTELKKKLAAGGKLPNVNNRESALDELSVLVNKRRKFSIDLKTEYKNRLKAEGLSSSPEHPEERVRRVKETSNKALYSTLFGAQAAA